MNHERWEDNAADQLSLRAGSAGLSESIRQAEGITMDDSGTLYICSEPDLLYIFDKSE